MKLRIDLADVYLLRRYRWYKLKGKRPYVYCRISGKTVYIHRLIMDAPRESDVDHIDGNPLNNSRRNLRLCNRSQNLAARVGVTSACGYRGVHYWKRKARYQAHIQKDGIKIHIGNFGSAEDAARAYDKKALELFGPFARLNFPQ